jgi:two-component system NarL family sensor kinase
LVVETLRSEQRERQRISEALHDFALQELLAAGQDLDDAASEVAGVAVARVQRARAGVARAARDLREAVTELHPVVLHHAGLAPAIDAVAQRQAARAGFTYELELDDAGRAGYEDVLVSLVRELLANVARHAEARTVWVRLSTDADHVVLEVRDDGRGLDATRTGRPPSDGSGSLASWAVRLEALGGTLSVQAGPNGGTIARASLPLATDS